MTEQIERRMDELEKRMVVAERDITIVGVEFRPIKGDLREIKDSLTWVTRLIIGSLILALVTFAISGGMFVG